MSLRTKTILGLTLIQFVLIGLMLLATLDFLEKSHKSEMRKNHDSITHLVASAVRESLIATDLADLSQVAKELLKDPHISFLQIVDGEGRLLVSQGNSEDFVDSASHEDHWGEYLGEGDHLHIRNLDFGTVKIGFDNHQFSASMRSIQLQLLAIAGIVVVASAVFSYILANFLLQRLIPIRDAAKNVTFGRFDRFLSVEQGDEISEVELAFNKMLQSVEETNGNLEQLVKSRTEQLQLQTERAKVADRVKTNFLSHMSHEIRTPLHAILSIVESLLEHEQEAAVASKLKIVMDSGDNLLTILNDMLDLSKMSGGKLRVNKVVTNIPAVLDSCCDLFDNAAKEKGLTIARTYSREDVWVLTDAIRIRQILFNLIGNGVKFTTKGGIEVDLHQREVDEKTLSLALIVRDSGIGIHREDLETIFEAFLQVERADGKTSPGSGLGLAVSAGLATLLGGSIEVESRVGEGSTFTLQLPLLQLTEPEARKERHQHLDRNHGEIRKRILVVEDNDVNREILADRLRHWGHQVDEAEDGREAVHKCTEIDYDVVLMDCQMPVMNGFVASEAIRALPGHQPLIVAVTAGISSEDRKRCFECGMDFFLRKPVRGVDLNKVIMSKRP